MSDTRVVFLAGPRQSGKSTLAEHVAGKDMPYLTLDDSTTLQAAANDPAGFIKGLDCAVIDEIQRLPELLLPIKASVDRDPRPGRFLLTGSANIMTLPKVADSLAGRMEIIRLLPLAQAELCARQPTFLESMMAGRTPAAGAPLYQGTLVEAVLTGGYPEAITRQRPVRRQTWHLDYVNAIVQRDVRDIAQVEHLDKMPKLLRILAEHSGQLVNYSAFGAPLSLNHVSMRKYAGILETLFLVEMLEPWASGRLRRLIKTPKLHFLDSGLLASLQNITPEHIAENRTPFGALLETFVLGELLKLSDWSDQRIGFYHFRDRDGYEVDIVMEDRHGRVAGVEVKASATVRDQDFKGLRKLREACDDRFTMGMVLYDGEYTVPFSDRLAAVPVSALWT